MRKIVQRKGCFELLILASTCLKKFSRRKILIFWYYPENKRDMLKCPIIPIRSVREYTFSWKQLNEPSFNHGLLL